MNIITEIEEIKKIYPEKPLGQARDLSKEIIGIDKITPIYRTINNNNKIQ